MANPFFDAAYYLAQNPDVEAAFGDDAAAAEAHYIANGADEGRKPAQWFDAAYYQSNNADLAGLAPNELFEHFANYGVNELRSPSEGLVLDAATFQAYAAANEDLVAAFGIEDVENLSNEDVAALANHFFAYGIHEGREGAPAMPEDLGDLTEALENLQDAIEARNDFLKEAAENEDVAAALDAADEDDGDLTVEAAIEQQLEALSTELENGPTEAQLNAAVVTAEANLAAAQAKYDAAETTPEFMAALKAYNAAMKDVRDQKAVRDQAQEAALAQYAAFEAANPVAKFTVVLEPEEGELPGVFLVGEDGELGDPVVKFVPAGDGGRAEVADGGEEYAGINQLVAAINDMLIEQDALKKEQADADTALEALKGVDLGKEADTEKGLYERLLDAEWALEQAEEAVVERAELAERVDALQALADQLEDHDEAVDDAREAIDELGFNLVEFDEDGNATGTIEDDVFVYNFTENATIDWFGAQGEDVLFISDKFTYNEDIENGDPAVLEVFITQEGSDAVVWLEQTPYGSNANEQEFDQIVLTGVNAEELTVVDGYVVFA